MSPNLSGRYQHSIEKAATATPIALEVQHPEERAYVKCPDCETLIPASVARCRPCATDRVIAWVEGGKK